MDVELEKETSSQGCCMAAIENSVDDCPILYLPTEVLLQVFSYLDSEFLTKSVSLVCKHFHAILSDKNVWKYRVRKRIKFKYPPLQGDEDTVNWQKVCGALEKERAYWSGYSENMIQLKSQDLHIAAVDAVSLLNGGSLCVSGSRDRSLGLWEVAENNIKAVYMRQDAHAGWIWALLADTHAQNMFFSSSWDNTVKCWDVNQGLCEHSSISMRVAVLSLAHIGTLVACGTFTGHASLLDLRVTKKVVMMLRPHTRATLAVASRHEHYLLSAGEEGSLASHDIRNPSQPVAQFVLRDNVGNKPERFPTYPKCLSIRGDTLYAGDSQGYIWLLNASGGNLQLVESCNVGHKGQITSVLHNEGVLLTSSMDRTLCAFVPSLPPEPLAVLQIGDQATAMDYKNGVMAAGTTGNQVVIYVPRINW